MHFLKQNCQKNFYQLNKTNTMYENINPHELQKSPVFQELFYIYFLFNEKDEIIYVGQTVNLYYRIHCHLKKIKNIKKMAFFQTSKEEANNAEAYFIVKYKPVFNKNIPQNDVYTSLKNFKKVSNLYGRNEMQVDKFIGHKKIEEINSFFRKKDLNEIFVLDDQKNSETFPMDNFTDFDFDKMGKMNLETYLFENRMCISTLAHKIGYNRCYLSDVVHGHKTAGKKLAKILEKETEGFVTDKQLRKEDEK